MPRLKPTAEVFGGFSLQDPFSSRFPNAATMKGAQVNPLWQQLSLDAWGTNYVRNFGDMTSRALKVVATVRGIPSMRVPGLEDVFANVPQLSAASGVADAFKTAIGDGRPTLQSALLGFAQGLELVATRVAIMGAVIKLGLTVYDFVSLALKGAQQQVTSPPKSPIAYSRSADQDAVNLQLGYVGQSNMTPLFLPASTSGNFATGALDYMGDGTPDGRFFAFDDANPKNGSVMPGMGDRVGYWQYPAKVSGGNRPSGPESVVTNAQLAPSAVQNGLLLWQMVLKPSVEMFSVDPHRISLEWRDFFDGLRAWALAQGDAQLKDVAWWSTAWQRPNGESRFPRWPVPGDAEAVPFGEYRADLPSLGDLVDRIVTTQLKPSLRPALRTLLCAYVPPTAPAFRHDPTLRDYYNRMRAKLLEHDAVADVELDLVPDDDFRTAVYYARMKLGGQGKLTAKPAGSQQAAGLPVVEPEGEPPPDDADLEPALPSDAESKGEEGGAGLLLGGVGVGLAAGAWWMWRKRRG